MKRRLYALLLCAVMSMGLCGCYADTLAELLQDTIPTTATTTTTLPSIEIPLTLLDAGYMYSKLNEKQQANYNAVVNMLYEKRGQDTKVDGKSGLDIPLPHMLETEQEVENLFRAVYDDHPELFYLDYRYSWLSIGKMHATLRLFYLWDAEERARKAIEVEAAVQSLTVNVQGLADVEKELVFYDTLTERCEYNEVAAGGSQDPEREREHSEASSTYAALCGGDPICGGYTRAFHLLLARSGIAWTPIRNDNHVWTMVWLDGDAYHVDVTWDDPTNGEESHQFVNVTDEEIRATREYPAQVFDVPAATVTTYNYHRRNGWYFDDAYDDRLGEVIRSQIENGKSAVELKFAPAVFEEAVAWLFEDETFFDAAYDLEDEALRNVWYNRVYHEKNESLGTIRIYPAPAEDEDTNE